MPRLNKRIRHLSTIMRELCQANSLETTIKLYCSLDIKELMTYGSFSKSLTCRVDLRSLRSQYGINVNPVKGYFVAWQKVGHVNFIVPIGSNEETHKDLSKMLQGAEDLLSNM